MRKKSVLEAIAALKISGKEIIVNKSLTLCLLTVDCTDNPHIIRLLSRWRKKHEAWFPSQFPVSGARTKVWLQQRVLDETDRLLFMVKYRSVFHGHVGLYRFDFRTKSCEIDNIVRGRKGYKGMMEDSIREMMQWGRDTLEIEYYTLQTTSDNVRALALYSKLGFVEAKRMAQNNRYTVYMKWRKI